MCKTLLAFLVLEVMLVLGLQSSCEQDSLCSQTHLKNMAFSRAENTVYTESLEPCSLTHSWPFYSGKEVPHCSPQSG